MRLFKKYWVLFCWLLGINLFFAWFSRPGLGYPSFEIAARAFWKTGSVFTQQLQPGQVEAIKTVKGLIFVYPPLPLIPMLFLTPLGIHEIWFARMMASLSAIVMWKIVYDLSKNKGRASILMLFYVLTTPMMFFSAHEGSWFTAQVMGVIVIQLAWIMYVREKWRFAGFLVGLAALCRLNLGLVTGSILLLELLRRKKYREMFAMGVAIVPAVMVYGWWNYFRFGDLLQSGYALIQGVTTEPWYQYGVINWRYIPGNLVKFVTQYNTRGDGLGIVWAQPFLLLLPLLITQNWLLFGVGSANFVMVLAHGYWGAWQFDFRFLFDSLWAWLPLFATLYGKKWYLSCALMVIAAIVHLVLLPVL
jgi:hypothetical protein